MTVTAVKPDFSGYATKANLECTDGRTIMPEAFQHMDGKKVPLVWQHNHKDPANVLGHAILTARPDGVWAEGYFNDTPSGQVSRALVEHGDVNALSIYANKLVERAKQVFHGVIREVSLCLAGANPGAFIENVSIRHSDGDLEEIDEAIIHFGLDSIITVDHDKEDEEIEHATVKEVYDSLSDEQKEVVNYMIGQALEASNSAEHSDGDDNNDEGDHADDNTEDENLEHQEGTDMTRNIFETQSAAGGQKTGELKHVMTVDDIKSIVKHADQVGSLKQAVEHYALQHGIENIDVLFPEAKNLTQTPEFDKRRTEWVAGVLNGVGKSPFAKVRSVVADITMDEARALGYIKGNFKKEEWFSLTARTTGPTTIYKKQKLDRDDIIDITDFDVVAWMKAEMRLMLEEEIAGAILIGDGRPVEDPDNAGQPNPDKIKDPGSAVDGTGIRSILNEHELYAPKVNFALDEADANNSYRELVEEVMLSMELYKGTGTPTFYTTQRILNRMLLVKDGMGRRLWRNKADLASEMGVDNIVPVEIFNRVPDLIGIIVNLTDYNVGTDRGGEVTFFDDFDIDYNQYKYLGETRLSGALKKIRSALVIKKVDATDTLVTPQEPTFNEDTGVVTIPTQTGVVYKNADTDATLTAGPQTALAPGATLNVVAVPANDTYYFPNTEVDDWSFTRPTA